MPDYHSLHSSRPSRDLHRRGRPGPAFLVSAVCLASMAWLTSFASMLSLPEAAAQRPTEGGLFAFDAGDTVESWDEPGGLIRVHFSVAGPNVTILTDDDADGIPDYAQDIATTAAEVLTFYQTQLGLRLPASEQDLGLDPLGGNFALDVYLVDFGLSADGSFGLDGCDESPRRCAGFLVIENDFAGYSYPSLRVAIDVLTSHELFHGVQYAYSDDVPRWISEGTAVWAEKQWDDDSEDFLRFARAYFSDMGRSIDRPPSGPVPIFAYSAGLWFDFLTTRYDESVINGLLEGLAAGPPDADAAEVLETVIGGAEELRDSWIEFSAWNLATGSRVGTAESYDYAAELSGVSAKVEGSSIDDDNRFFPLATTYYRLDHAGGQVWFGAEEAAPELSFALFPVEGGEQDGPLGAAVATWSAESASSAPVADGADLDAGGYWLVGTLPARADQSTRLRFCLGDEASATECAAQDGGCSASAGSSGSTALFLLLLSALFIATRRRSTMSAVPGLR